MNLKPSFDIHIQRTLVVLFGPRSLPVSFDRVSCRITLCDVQLVPAELIASSIQKRHAYTFSSMAGGYEEAHDRPDWLGGIVHYASIPPHV